MRVKIMIPSSEQTTKDTDRLHIRLKDPTWTLWRQAILRGAGFPAEYALRLASAESAAATAQILQLEQEYGQMKRTAVDLLKTLRSADATRIKVYTNAIHRLHAGKIPAASDFPAQAQEVIEQLRQIQEQLGDAQQAYLHGFKRNFANAAEQLRDIVADDVFQQAIAWQNRQALHTGLKPFLTQPLEHQKHHRMMLAKYLQRYCLKNDTIGFFGPVGWAYWTENIATDLQLGSTLLAKRTTYVEGWCVNAIGAALAAEYPQMLRWAKPCLAPYIRVSQNKLYVPFTAPIALSSAQFAVLMACNGAASAIAIAERLPKEGILGLTHPSDVYEILATLQSSRRITWSMDVSLENPFPERAFRKNIEQIADTKLREIALSVVSDLEQHVRNAQQANTSSEIDRAIADFETWFTSVTQQSATRSSGALYAGSTLLSEDCVRAAEARLGVSVLQGLEAPLALILTSARWLGYQLAEGCREFFQDSYDKLALKNKTSKISFAEYYSWVFSQFTADVQPYLQPAQQMFYQKWAAILPDATGLRRIDLSSDAIDHQIRELFAAPGPGWNSAYFHSPDIMFAAENLDALNRTDFLYVLGELHLGMNTLDGNLFTEQNPNAADMFAAMQEDIPFPLVLPIASSQALPSSRIQQSLALPKDVRLAATTDVCDAPSSQIVRLGDLVIERIDGELSVHTYDEQRRFDVMDVFSDYFSVIAGDYFALFPQQEHTPRVTLDRLVVVRESWKFYADQLQFATVQDQAESYLALRRWAQRLGMPRFLFYRTWKERKPCYLDLDSPIYAELFIKEIHSALQGAAPMDEFVLSVSEMTPTPDQAWLTDAQGRHYVSEIRIAAVDKKLEYITETHIKEAYSK